jgi:hypothetical protein
MPCQSPYFLIDEIGGFWNLLVAPSGLIQINPTLSPANAPVTAILLHDSVTNQSWRLTVLSVGNLMVTAAVINPTPPTLLFLRSVDGAPWDIFIASGLLSTKVAVVIPTPTPVVGRIYNPDTAAYLPPFTQPGGPGTATFPQQDPGQMIGLFVAGCGHWFNNWDVISATVACDQVAVMRCPLCQYVQRIIDPYNDIYSFQNEILLA